MNRIYFKIIVRITKSKYLSNICLQVLLMMAKKAQDHEIHKQISWEPHGVFTYQKITFKIDFMPNSSATQPIIFLLVSSAKKVSVMYTETSQANRTTFEN